MKYPGTLLKISDSLKKLVFQAPGALDEDEVTQISQLAIRAEPSATRRIKWLQQQIALKPVLKIGEEKLECDGPLRVSADFRRECAIKMIDEIFELLNEFTISSKSEENFKKILEKHPERVPFKLRHANEKTALNGIKSLYALCLEPEKFPWLRTSEAALWLELDLTKALKSLLDYPAVAFHAETLLQSLKPAT